jgi:hypothetical protein
MSGMTPSTQMLGLRLRPGACLVLSLASEMISSPEPYLRNAWDKETVEQGLRWAI